MVTATSSGGWSTFCSASRAAASIRRPPEACTFTIQTPKSAAAAQARATVLASCVASLASAWSTAISSTLDPRIAVAVIFPESASAASSSERVLCSVAPQKARFALAEKGLEWESRHVDLFTFDHWKPEYLALNHKAVVPTLDHDGRVLIESNVIIEYLDDAFPGSALSPADPMARARMRLWLYDSEAIAHPAVNTASYNPRHAPRLFPTSSSLGSFGASAAFGLTKARVVRLSGSKAEWQLSHATALSPGRTVTGVRPSGQWMGHSAMGASPRAVVPAASMPRVETTTVPVHGCVWEPRRNQYLTRGYDGGPAALARAGSRPTERFVQPGLNASFSVPWPVPPRLRGRTPGSCG